MNVTTKRRTTCKRGDALMRSASFLYTNAVGRDLLKILIQPWVSRVGGVVADSGFSRLFIRRFVKKHAIDTKRFEERKYRSFNDFFTRKLKENCFDASPDALISPCDALVTYYEITDSAIFGIKGSEYTVASLTGNEEDAQKYRGGTCLVFRLCVNDYHRYCFFDDGCIISSKKIKGVLHTVQPIAHAPADVFVQNSREVTYLDTDNFSESVQIEVGALLVGRITNDHTAREFRRGQEKGRFEFGGSTIVLLLKKGAALTDEEIVSNSLAGLETRVFCGERIGSTSR